MSRLARLLALLALIVLVVVIGLWWRGRRITPDPIDPTTTSGSSSTTTSAATGTTEAAVATDLPDELELPPPAEGQTYPMLAVTSAPLERHAQTTYAHAGRLDGQHDAWYDVGTAAKATAVGSLDEATPAALWGYSKPPHDTRRDAVLLSVNCVQQPAQGVRPWKAVGAEPPANRTELEVTYVDGATDRTVVLQLGSAAAAHDLWLFFTTLKSGGFDHQALSLGFRYTARSSPDPGWSLEPMTGSVTGIFTFPVKGQVTAP